jgi:hypothetical protein
VAVRLCGHQPGCRGKPPEQVQPATPLHRTQPAPGFPRLPDCEQIVSSTAHGYASSLRLRSLARSICRLISLCHPCACSVERTAEGEGHRPSAPGRCSVRNRDIADVGSLRDEVSLIGAPFRQRMQRPASVPGGSRNFAPSPPHRPSGRIVRPCLYSAPPPAQGRGSELAPLPGKSAL